jgi:excisionase family DNA binding protein
VTSPKRRYRVPFPIEDPLLTTGEAARRLGISPRTILVWTKQGKLPSLLTPGHHRRFKSSDVDALLTGHMAPRNERTGEVIT